VADAGTAVTAILAWWGIVAAAIVCLAAAVGLLINKRVTGILIDTRGRYSLTHFQVILWTITILSLIAGTFAGRWQHHVPDPLQFTVPSAVLGVLAISLGSGVVSTVVKSSKDAKRLPNIAASEPSRAAALAQLDQSWRPRFAQIFMQEEGDYADQVVDVGKFQNFIITLVLVVAYIGSVISAVHNAKTAGNFTALPTFEGTFLTLLAISHGAYVAAKIPPQQGTPKTSLSARPALNAVAEAAAKTAAKAAAAEAAAKAAAAEAAAEAAAKAAAAEVAAEAAAKAKAAAESSTDGGRH
jgi:hypothetical protein